VGGASYLNTENTENPLIAGRSQSSPTGYNRPDRRVGEFKTSSIHDLSSGQRNAWVATITNKLSIPCYCYYLPQKHAHPQELERRPSLGLRRLSHTWKLIPSISSSSINWFQWFFVTGSSIRLISTPVNDARSH